jgi:hypothetical protein
MEKEKMKYLLLIVLALPVANHTLAADVDCQQKTAELLASLNAANLTSASDEGISREVTKFCEEVVVTAQQTQEDEWLAMLSNKPGHERLKRRARK